MNIIEREIEKRQNILDDIQFNNDLIAEKNSQILQLQAAIDELVERNSKVDVETLKAEIKELRDYLPKTCEAAEPVETAESDNCEAVEEETVEVSESVVVDECASEPVEAKETVEAIDEAVEAVDNACEASEAVQA